MRTFNFDDIYKLSKVYPECHSIVMSYSQRIAFIVKHGKKPFHDKPKVIYSDKIKDHMCLYVRCGTNCYPNDATIIWSEGDPIPSREENKMHVPDDLRPTIEKTHTFTAELDGEELVMPPPDREGWEKGETERFKRGDRRIHHSAWQKINDGPRLVKGFQLRDPESKNHRFANNTHSCWFHEYAKRLTTQYAPILSITTWTRKEKIIDAIIPYNYHCPSKENKIGLEIWPDGKHPSGPLKTGE